jgi:predicted ATPase
LEALIRQLEHLTREQPVLMVFEDLHWIDPTSRELLDLTVERVRGLSVLLIATFRPEFQPTWTGQPRVTMLALNRLDWPDRVSLAAQIAGKILPEIVFEQIADRTDGVPLFEAPPSWWTPLLSSAGSGKVSNGPGTASIHR